MVTTIHFHPYTTDPLAGLDPELHALDGALWEALLEDAYTPVAAVDPTGTFGLMRGLRAMGCGLAPDDGGTMRLWPPAYADRDTLVDWIGDDAAEVRRMVARAGELASGGLERVA